MKKIMTLEQSWIACLAMWRFIADNYVSDKVRGVRSLKRIWLRNNKGWLKEQGIRVNVKYDCFFCQYNEEKNGDSAYFDDGDCSSNALCQQCPGKLVSKRFQCEDYESYNWNGKPKQFYKKLLVLHEKYKNN